MQQHFVPPHRQHPGPATYNLVQGPGGPTSPPAVYTTQPGGTATRFSPSIPVHRPRVAEPNYPVLGTPSQPVRAEPPTPLSGVDDEQAYRVYGPLSGRSGGSSNLSGGGFPSGPPTSGRSAGAAGGDHRAALMGHGTATA